MSIKVHLYSSLQSRTENRNLVEVEGNTVGQCLNDLVRHYPKLKSELFDKSGKLSPQIFVSINLNSPNPEKLDAAVTAADQLYIVLIVAGG